MQHCPDANCPRDIITSGGAVVEPKTGRTYFLDYPCDLKRGEKVAFILSLHGGGSYGNWQRHYFPIVDYKDKYRLVIATPFSPRRSWSAEDDEYLQNIVSSVIEQIGKENINAFWLAGHSQGGLTSRRIVCTDFFAAKADGFLSLSGGRIGGSPQRAANAGRPPQANASPASPAAPTPSGAPPGALAPTSPPTCDFSHIYATGEHEIAALPDTSEWANKYSCGPRVKQPEVVDIKAGYVHDSTRQNPGSKSWGLLPRGGKAEVFVYSKCSEGRVVADVVRIDKGHTEGLEPQVTEALVKLMLSARGGKISGR
jgi:poly(3-hydroxybutyrate) depolymerase